MLKSWFIGLYSRKDNLWGMCILGSAIPVMVSWDVQPLILFSTDKRKALMQILHEGKT
jgi:hypothetical protein